jgi:hypothetical protein
MPYTALRSFKVKGFDGTYRQVKAGDPVPEAKDWKDRKAYVERRWIARDEDAAEALAPGQPRLYAATKELPAKSPRPKAKKGRKKQAKKKAPEPTPEPPPEQPEIETSAAPTPLPGLPPDEQTPEAAEPPSGSTAASEGRPPETEKPGNR